MFDNIERDKAYQRDCNIICFHSGHGQSPPPASWAIKRIKVCTKIKSRKLREREGARKSGKKVKHSNDALPCTCPKIRAAGGVECRWGGVCVRAGVKAFSVVLGGHFSLN